MVTDILQHHGILGMKWGIRRYQNPDGSLTAEGKQRQMYRRRTMNAGKTMKDVNDIISTMSDDDKKKLAVDKDGYLTYEQGSAVIKRFMTKYKDTPVSFFDLLDDGDQINIALGTRSGSKYRGKGYASKTVKKAMRWVDKNVNRLTQNEMIWGVMVDNIGSIRLAEKNGFTIDPDSYSDDKQWVNYVRRLRKE